MLTRRKAANHSQSGICHVCAISVNNQTINGPDENVDGIAPAISIPYFSHDGTDPAIRFRVALDGPDRFRWRKGSRPRLAG